MSTNDPASNSAHISSLPCAGRISCHKCHNTYEISFDKTQRTEGDWRITANPLAWGNPKAEIVVLGFSKGPTQAGALTRSHHEEIAYKGGRANVGKIFAHLGLVPQGDTSILKKSIDQLIADRHGRFHFGSLVRCTVERRDSGGWKGSGGGMLDKFIGTPFGRQVANNCASRFLGRLPPQTRLVLMFGMGNKGNYIEASRQLLESALPGNWREINEVAYSDGKTSFVHVEHFAAQGSLLPNWLGVNNHPRARLGILAKDAVEQALA